MEDRENANASQARGKGWTILFVVLALANLAEYFYASGHESHRLLVGIGFLLAAPQMYVRPPRPLWGRARQTAPAAGRRFDWIDGVGLAGLTMVVAGMAMRFLG